MAWVPWKERPLGTRVAFNVADPNNELPFQVLEKEEILNSLWGGTNNPYWGIRQRRLDDFDPFFNYLRIKCDFIDGDEHVVQNYGQLMDLIGQMKVSRGKSRKQICADLEAALPNVVGDEAKAKQRANIQRSMTLAVELWLMISIGSEELNPDTKEPPLPWHHNETINGFLESNFKQKHLKEDDLFTESPGDDEDREFSDILNLRDIEYLAGFKVVWTNDILNHLLIQKHPQSKFETRVLVFHQATVLRELMLGGSQSKLGHNGALAKETLETLGLLLPPRHQLWFEQKIAPRLTMDDINSQMKPVSIFGVEIWDGNLFSWPNNWIFKLVFGRGVTIHQLNAWRNLTHRPTPIKTQLKKLLAEKASVDPLAGQQYREPRTEHRKPMPRRVNHYPYWQKRLLVLEEEFNESKRASLSTYFHDRRKPRDWANFWGAMLVLGFAILAFLIAFVALVVAGVTLDEAKKANTIAVGASKAADDGVASLVEAINSTRAYPLPIIVCCSANTTSSSPSTPVTFLLPSTSNTPTVVVVTSTVQAFATVTTSVIISLTSTFVVSAPTST